MLLALIAVASLAVLGCESGLLTSTGFYGLTGLDYQNARHGLHYNNLGKVIFEHGQSEGWRLMHCIRECLKLETCHAIILKPHECDLSSYDRCANQGKALIWHNNHRIFELRPGDAADHHTTCYQQCGGVCDVCGRRYCWGDDCTNCTHACWDPLLVDKAANLYLWPRSNPSSYRFVNCDLGWQKVWGVILSEVELNIYPQMLDQPLKLRVRVKYNDSTVLESFFSSFDYDFDSLTISVGDFIEGDAGNFWGAPFVNRKEVGIGNCLPFFYPDMDSCSPTGGVGTGYFWDTAGMATTPASSNGTNASTTSQEINATAYGTTDSMDNSTAEMLTYSNETTTSLVSQSTTTTTATPTTTRPGTSTTTTTAVISTTESITYGIHEIELWVTPNLQ